MKIYVATVSEKALNVRSREAYYARQKRLFVLVIGAVSILPLAAHIWLASQEYRQSWIEKTSSDLLSLARSRNETITLFLESQENLLAGYVEINGMRDLVGPGKLEKVFAAINKSGVITDLGIIGKHGEHLAYVGPYEKELSQRNYAQAEWFQHTMNTGRYVSDIFLGYRKVPHQIVAVASRDRSWILRATINSEMFNNLLASADVGPGGDAFIINLKGELQTPSRHGLKSLNPDTIMPASGMREDGGTRLADGYITAAVPFKGSNKWLMVLRTNVDSSLSEFYAARRRDLLIMALAAIGIVGFAAFSVRSMVGKIEAADRTRATLNDRVREAEKMALVGRIAASVAHEINNPLQIIGDQAGLLREMIQEEHAIPQDRIAEYTDTANSISRNVKRASAVTHRLLGFSRSKGEEFSISDINQMLEETIGFIEKESHANNIDINRQFDDNLPRAFTDACQLQQVFLNLLNNAAEAIGQNGSITIRTSRINDEIIVEIADSGAGLAPEVQQKIFDPFFSTKDGRGTGLGLSISFNIMQRLGGRLNARNGSHKGAVFTVSVPCVNSTAGAS